MASYVFILKRKRKKIMKKLFITISIFSILFTYMSANENDSVKTIHLGQVDIYSLKETNHQNAPVSSTLLTQRKIDQAQVTSVKDLSAKIPNFYIPDYGSAMSNSPYVRGVGSRSSGQSISLYVDNVPYLEKSAFDFELYDLAQIEVLRGPQGTLYGRNSIGGIVNIYTLSPLSYQGARVSLTAGNYGLMQAKASYYTLLNQKVGLAAGGYYGKQDGFYKNDFTGKNVDSEKTAGGRVKLAWNVSQQLKLNYAIDFDYIDQGAFPYGLYNAETKTTANPNFNDLGHYSRKTLNNSLSSKYLSDDLTFTVSLSHQYFDDQMDMDQDYSPASIFTIQQSQKQNMLNGEAIIRFVSDGNYKWLVGVNGFGQQNDMYAPVTFKEDGIKNILQPNLPPILTIKNTMYEIPGWFNNNRSGGALFHQSTFDNLITKGLSLTFGMRLDVEDVRLDYNTNSSMDMEMRQGPKVIPMTIKSDLIGSVDTTFVAFLPKASLKYEWDFKNFVYASVARGYKTGGFNVQMISDLMTEKLRAMGPNAVEPDVKHRTMYQPEMSWNYELGLHNTFFDNMLRTDLTLFYMDISGMQLTEFIANGAGRKLTNAGTSVSKGVEISADLDLGAELNLGVNYGFAHATFKNYKDVKTINGKNIEIDYAGKFVPYAPQQTINVSLNYLKKLDNSFLSQIYGTVSYGGIGKIYWDESNVLAENFYTLVDAKLGVKKNIFGLEIWGKNLLNTEYNAFYFESFSNKFFQKGKPLQLGVRLTMVM